MSEACMFLENGKCLCEKRYYETNSCPECDKINNCYYKRAIRAEKTLTLIERIAGFGINIVKKYSEYRVKVNKNEAVGNKLSTVLIEIVKKVEKEENDE